MRRLSIKFITYFILLALVVCPVLTGCSALVSPYSTTFQCPDSDKGKCVSVQTAYDESLELNPLVKEQVCEDCEEKEKTKVSNEETPDEKKMETLPSDKTLSDAHAPNNAKYDYQDALYKKLTSIIDQPETPLVIPPDVMRVLIPSYTGADNEWFSARYVYFFVTEPKWAVSAATEERE
ncbi:MAG: type IV conjugative transfer system protein TraV [Desulfobacteraceae bacterium]|nr:MAG: type IV conjugative transfer system protein TraV [Desulfobacteraceae bacterium]